MLQLPSQMRVLIETVRTDNPHRQKRKNIQCVVFGKSAEFAESRSESQRNVGTPNADAGDGFMNIPDGIDEELPFQ